MEQSQENKVDVDDRAEQSILMYTKITVRVGNQTNDIYAKVTTTYASILI